MTIDAHDPASHRRTAPLLILIITCAGAALGLMAGAWTAGVLHLPTSPHATRTSPSEHRPLGQATFPRLSVSYTTAVRGDSTLYGTIAPPGGPVSIMIIPPNGISVPPSQVDLRLRMGSRRQIPQLTRCGLWCYRFAAPVLQGSAATITIRLPTSTSPSRLTLPARLPANESARYALAVRRMTSVPAVAAIQALSSGSGPAVVTRYAMQAPNRLEYATSSGQHAVLIGNHRWDTHHGTWVECPASAGHDPTYVWQRATAAHAGGQLTHDSRGLLLVHVFNPSVPAWFTLQIASDGRVASAHMLAPSHFMHENYQLGSTVQIRPPKRFTSGTKNGTC